MDSRFGPNRRATLATPLALDSGATLPAIDIAYETYGTLSPARDNAILPPTRCRP